MMTPFPRRVINIVFRPHREWSVIKAEQSTYQQVLFRYVASLTLLPILAITCPVAVELLEHSQVSPIYRSVAWDSLRLGFQWYLINLINVAIIGVAFQRLFPAFSVSRDKVRGLKISAYAATPLLIAISLTAIPYVIFDWLALFALLYSVYLMYLAVVVLMDIPKTRAVWYVAGSLLASAVIIGIIDTAIIRLEDFAVRALRRIA